MQRTPEASSRSAGSAVLALLLVVLMVIALAAVSIRTLLQNRRDQNERTAVQTILQVNTALFKYRQAHPDSYPPSLKAVSEIDAGLKCGQPTCLKSGYSFQYELLPATNMGPRYVLQVRPNKYANTGVQSFYSDESGVIRGTSQDRPASAGDGPVS